LSQTAQKAWYFSDPTAVFTIRIQHYLSHNYTVQRKEAFTIL
jgi:hypothetical protein